MHRRVNVKKLDNLVVGLDIGTTKICAVVGDVIDNQLNIIGIGKYPSKGLRKGVVINIDATVDSIKKTIEEAELMAGCEITSVYAGVAGGHIKGMNSHGIIAVKSREITPRDVQRVIETASAVALPLDREVIHVIPQEFIVDDQTGIRDPVGMAGVRLEGKVHIITGAVTSAQNIIKCANKAGLDVNDIILEQLGASEAVLDRDEREIGVALLDIGGGTTDLAIFVGGTIQHTSVIALAGNHVTHDISIGLRTPKQEAERLKIRYGCALASMIRKDETIEVPSVGGRKPRILSRKTLAEIIEPRMEEIFELVNQNLNDSGLADLLGAGIVLTGGGSIMEGTVELAERVFGMPIRLGVPRWIGGLTDLVTSPLYATSVGLALYGSKNLHQTRFKAQDTNIFKKVLVRMKEWLGEYF
ncbi:MAG: cell division protein FtsA [Deltaproteobacteria bacterium]|nr:MAG: cell division protein FtsA [Deltaproteobacteria bacterium]